MDVKSVVLTGVGGQGILTIARILGLALVNAKVNVIISEVHGMAQRGGSVIVHVKFGRDAHSPLVPEGSADLIASLEMIEALRYIRYAHSETILIVNRRIIPPPLPKVKVPSITELEEELKATIRNTYIIDCEKLALKAGSILSANMVLLGSIVASGVVNAPKKVFIESITTSFPPRYVEVNVKAFNLGYEFMKSLIQNQR